ncbi:MAG: nucleotide exchange factor GrpE [Oscillospiraceae bacterium]|nr:nucleotide exchange factor GrpE [Oscillospiraceae bacterium]
MSEEIREDLPEEEEIVEDEVLEAAEEETDEADAADEMAEKLAQMQEQYVRLYAEFDNFRKRTAKEKLETYTDATAKSVEQLLPVLDNFERAIDAPCTDEQYKNGMEMIFTQLKTMLEKMGVTEIESLGAEFNPNIHQAIKRSEANEEFAENTVCEVFQKGYMLKDRLVRPAMVAVAG